MTIYVSVEGNCEDEKKNVTTCSDCISRGTECYFCIKHGESKKNGTCIKAKWDPEGCSNFYAVTCDIEGVIWVSLVGVGAAIVLLLFIGCIIYCCCCRGKSKRRRQFETRDKEDKQRRQDMKERQDARRADRKAKNDAIRKKYGLYKDEELNDAPFSSPSTGRYQRFDSD